MSQRRRAGLLVALVLCGFASAASAQVVSDPNQIRWTVELVSPEPDVAAHLAEPSPSNWSVTATSFGAIPQLRHSSSGSGATRGRGAGEITVQAGDPGVPHDLQWQRGGDTYHVAPVRSGPVSPEPAPDVDVLASECVAFVRVAWRTPLGASIPVTSAEIIALVGGSPQATTRVGAGATSGRVLVRADGSEVTIRLTVTTGTDPFSDQLSFRAAASGRLECGRSIDLTHVLPSDGLPGNLIECMSDPSWGSGSDPGGGPVGFALGRIVGRFDVVGHEELLDEGPSTNAMSSLVQATYGPWGNYRYDLIRSAPSSGAFELENLIPSTVVAPADGYEARAKAVVGSGSRACVVLPPAPQVLVQDGATVDLGDLFVAEPATVFGDIRLVGPPAPPDRGDSLMLDLHRYDDPTSDDSDGDGIPNSYSYLYVHSARARMPDGSVVVGGGAMSQAWVAGDVTAGDELSTTYEMPVMALGGASADWYPTQLVAHFLDNRSGPPLTYVEARMHVSDRAAPIVTLEAGESVRRDLTYCFGELRMRFRSTSGTFTSPRLETRGSAGFAGTDFEGRAASYSVLLERAVGQPTFTPGSEGVVVAPLPEGDYVLWPKVTAVNPGGGTSLVELPPVTVSVGCRQVIEALTDLVMRLEPVASCVDTGTAALRGSVVGAADVARITGAVEGGVTVEACAPCGVEPAFEMELPVDAGLSTITVTAETVAGERVSVLVRVNAVPPPADPAPLTRRLMVRKDPLVGLELSWDAAEVAEVHAGTIDALWRGRRYDHGASAGACGVDGGRAALALPSHDAYYLVRGTCGSQARSLGRDSFGWQRPPPAPACR